MILFQLLTVLALAGNRLEEAEDAGAATSRCVDKVERWVGFYGQKSMEVYALHLAAYYELDHDDVNLEVEAHVRGNHFFKITFCADKESTNQRIENKMLWSQARILSLAADVVTPFYAGYEPGDICFDAQAKDCPHNEFETDFPDLEVDCVVCYSKNPKGRRELMELELDLNLGGPGLYASKYVGYPFARGHYHGYDEYRYVRWYGYAGY